MKWGYPNTWQMSLVAWNFYFWLGAEAENLDYNEISRRII